MSDIVALKHRHKAEYYLLPIEDDKNMIMEYNYRTKTWILREGGMAWSYMAGMKVYEPLYELVVDK